MSVGSHPEQPGRLAARLLADDSDIKQHHFGDVMSTGKLLSLNVNFQIEMETNIIGQNMQQIDISYIVNNVV
jgi:hypothetical protein